MELEQTHNHNQLGYLAVDKAEDNKREEACLGSHCNLVLGPCSDRKLQEVEVDLEVVADLDKGSDYQLNSNQEEADLAKGNHRTRRTFLEVQLRVVDLALDKELALGRDKHKVSRGEVKTRGDKRTRSEQDSKRKSRVNKHRIHSRGTITSSLQRTQAIIKYLER